MKIETRNQLIGVIIGTAIAIGISLVPGLDGGRRMWAIGTVAVAASWAVKYLGKKVKGGIPGFR